MKQVPAHPNNFGVGRANKTISMVVVHWIVGNLSSADATFQSPTRKASAHYGVENGEIHQYVQEKDTAWHASNLDINQRSIGIEHSGGELQSDGTRRNPSESTHQTSGKLIGEICRRYNIPIDKEHILPHKNFSSTQCPGTLDINKLITIAQGSEDSMTYQQFYNKFLEAFRKHESDIAWGDDKHKFEAEGLNDDAMIGRMIDEIARDSKAKDDRITELSNMPVPQPPAPPETPPEEITVNMKQWKLNGINYQAGKMVGNYERKA